jgi:hypothetical protein
MLCTRRVTRVGFTDVVVKVLMLLRMDLCVLWRPSISLYIDTVLYDIIQRSYKLVVMAILNVLHILFLSQVVYIYIYIYIYHLCCEQVNCINNTASTDAISSVLRDSLNGDQFWLLSLIFASNVMRAGLLSDVASVPSPQWRTLRLIRLYNMVPLPPYKNEIKTHTWEMWWTWVTAPRRGRLLAQCLKCSTN